MLNDRVTNKCKAGDGNDGVVDHYLHEHCARVNFTFHFQNKHYEPLWCGS